MKSGPDLHKEAIYTSIKVNRFSGPLIYSVYTITCLPESLILHDSCKNLAIKGSQS